MCNLEELKSCRIVKYANEYYLVENDALYWVNLVSGVRILVGDLIYSKVVCAYKTFNDYLNDKPYFKSKDDLLSTATKEWLRYIVRSLKGIDIETLELEVCEGYCNVNFRTYSGYYDGFVLPNYEFIIHDFSKLEKDEIYTFKELGIKL